MSSACEIPSNVEEQLVPPHELGVHTRDEMFSLFTAYYDGILRTNFEEDLADKNLVILLRARDRRLLGFTTLSIHDATHESHPIRYLFSGDTVMDSNNWGPGHLLKSWFRLAGSIKAQHPQTRLYWFLLVMGHRTYRILPDFFRSHAPRLRARQSEALIRLRDALAIARYGDAFDPLTGLVAFPASRGQLGMHWQDAHGRAHLPAVQDFLKLNPRHAHGVELGCIAELAEANLKSYAATEFRNGMHAQRERLALLG